MQEYHKIQTLYKRDMSSRQKTIIEGAYSWPEFEYLANNIWVFTEKVDGTNIRVKYLNGAISFAGKTDSAETPAPLLARLQERFLPMTSQFASLFNADVCVYGEGYGAKVQKGGGKYRPDQDFVLFDIKIGDWWLQRKDVEEIARTLELDIVPVIGEGRLQDAADLAKKGIQSTWGNFEAEGIVARPKVELKTPFFDLFKRKKVISIPAR